MSAAISVASSSTFLALRGKTGSVCWASQVNNIFSLLQPRWGRWISACSTIKKTTHSTARSIKPRYVSAPGEDQTCLELATFVLHYGATRALPKPRGHPGAVAVPSQCRVRAVCGDRWVNLHLGAALGALLSPNRSHPFDSSTSIPTPAASALSFLSIPAFPAFPAGQRWLLIPMTRWLQLLMLFRRAPNPMLLFT